MQRLVLLRLGPGLDPLAVARGLSARALDAVALRGGHGVVGTVDDTSREAWAARLGACLARVTRDDFGSGWVGRALVGASAAGEARRRAAGVLPPGAFGVAVQVDVRRMAELAGALRELDVDVILSDLGPVVQARLDAFLRGARDETRAERRAL